MKKNKTTDEKFWSEDVEYTYGGIGLKDHEIKRRLSLIVEDYITNMLKDKGITWEEYVEEIRQKVLESKKDKK